MKLHADFSKRVEINTNEMEWIASPAGGVDRKMLDRIGDESTCDIYRPIRSGQCLSRTRTPAWRRILCPGGCFLRRTRRLSRRDLRSESGRYTAFTVQQGRLYDLVKLRQFEQTDDRHFSINTATADWKPRGLPGLSVIHLHEHETETVRLVSSIPVPELRTTRIRAARNSSCSKAHSTMSTETIQREHGCVSRTAAVIRRGATTVASYG